MKILMILAVAALASCSLPGCGADESRIQLGLQWNFEPDPLPELLVSLREGRRVVEHPLDSSHRTIGPLKTGSSGTLTIEFVMLCDGEPSATSGSIELPLKGNWAWGVDFFIAVDDPRQTCMGCYGSRAFDLDPLLGYVGGEKLYILWGGNSISDPVVY